MCRKRILWGPSSNRGSLERASSCPCLKTMGVSHGIIFCQPPSLVAPLPQTDIYVQEIARHGIAEVRNQGSIHGERAELRAANSAVCQGFALPANRGGLGSGLKFSWRFASSRKSAVLGLVPPQLPERFPSMTSGPHPAYKLSSRRNHATIDG
jgi:hypothetical protein